MEAVGGGGGHGWRRRSGVQRRARFGSGMGKEWRGRSGTSVARAKGGGEGRGRKRAEEVAHGTAQRVVAVAHRETSGETGDGGGPGARHVADGAGVRQRTPSSRRETERERWSEGNLVIKLKFKNSSL